MIHSSTNVVLLAFVTLWSLVVISGRAVVVVVDSVFVHCSSSFGGSARCAWAIVGIMSHFATLEAAIGLNWVVVPDWCS